MIRTILIAVMLSFTVLYAGNTHNHDLPNHSNCDALHLQTKSTAIQEIAKQELKRLVLSKRIPKSWKSVPVKKLGKTNDSYHNDWVVVFENLKIKKKARQNLHIFITVYGQVIARNYTGK